MPKPIDLIIHGHFYQPPRENPWTGQIERQPSAAPYHDWNERVAAECYTPNSRSRVLDGRGRILEVVNNYEHISYNFGPTLLSWMEEQLPHTYQRLVVADGESLDRRGWGNAMAQVYNHLIMPLATARDRWTQIQWGLSDFRARFGREPQGMWLAETAINEAVAADLARAGIGFVILAPSQAERIRPPGKSRWRDVTAGDIPTHRAYRCHTPQGELTVLFYHAGMARGVAFEHLLRNAGTFADRIEAAAAEIPAADEADGRLVMVATDGESYGHHEAMGDMCLSYLATREAPARGIRLTNPAAYLAEHPARWEVRLKRGGGGLGTAWSCAHGVGRWREDCGCSTGGPPSWNQAWRAPLREAFDRLRQKIDPLFERRAGRYLTDPWAARDDYIQVILGRPLGAARRFFEQHARRPLGDEERLEVFRLLEMQRHGMLMYTSCGWFFADVSGIETVQDLAYFARAAQLAELVAGGEQDEDSLRILARAKSNLPEMGDGARVVERFVEPSRLTPAKAAAQLGVGRLLDIGPERERPSAFRVRVHDELRAERNGLRALRCRLTVRAERTGEGGTFDVGVLAGSELKLCALVRPYRAELGSPGADELLGAVEALGFAGACEQLGARFGQRLGLADMLHDVRLAAMEVLIRPVIEELDETFDALYRRHEGLLRNLTPLGVGVPEALRAPVGYAASRRFEQLVERGLAAADLSAAAELARMARELGIPLRLHRANRRAGRALAARLAEVLADPKPAALASLQALIDAARQMGLEPDEARLQDRVAEVLDELLAELLDPAQPGGPRRETARAWVELAGYLNLNVDEARKRIEAGGEEKG